MSVGGQLSKKTDENADELSLMFGGKEFMVFDLDGNYIKTTTSQTSFANELGVNVTTVNNILRGLKNSTKGYTLIYKDEFSEEKLNKLIKKINDWHKEFVVFDMKGSFIGRWDNKKQCSKTLNFSRRTLQRQLSENKSQSQNIKYQSYYIENIPEHLKDKVKDVI